jgi:hypothetical protein
MTPHRIRTIKYILDSNLKPHKVVFSGFLLSIRWANAGNWAGTRIFENRGNGF